ncbi:hypothetical protein [Desulfovibrio sp.]|uniref:hypothetical protein n=1 Tax=Desulfovibrio sp. TaxID=885 RepID=UPI0025C106D8|nr:hypothetical protein [Desulfovibrio sp.]
MKWSEFSTARAACAYFFICPGLVYGLLTARLPALKTQTGADDAQIGLILLCLGVSGLAALCGSARLIARWGSRAVLRLGSLALLFFSSVLRAGLHAAVARFGLRAGRLRHWFGRCRHEHAGDTD